VVSPLWLRVPSQLRGARNQSNMVHTEVRLQNPTVGAGMRRDDVGRSRHDHHINGRRKGRCRMERLSILDRSQTREPGSSAARYLFKVEQ
jgi:hypothetical protein